MPKTAEPIRIRLSIALLAGGWNGATLTGLSCIVDTVLIDQEAVYAPHEGDDRLLLGLTGSFNEHELDLLRQCSLCPFAK